jgi:uncharacterized membrane protein YraQ (UPF0718 family)
LLGRNGFWRALAALAVGMLSPLSIMSQLPVSGSLVRLGANPALLLGFLAAERSYDFQSFPIIAGFFGTRFAALNSAAIFLSLVAAFAAQFHSAVVFREPKGKESANGFLRRQGMLLAVVIGGLVVAAAVRSAVPEQAFAGLAKTELGGSAVGVASGFGLYFGSILGNYPVAKAFAELGMSATGVFAFLTVSPLFNAVVIGLFVSVARITDVVRFFAAYTVSALALSLVIGRFLL